VCVVDEFLLHPCFILEAVSDDSCTRVSFWRPSVMIPVGPSYPPSVRFVFVP